MSADTFAATTALLTRQEGAILLTGPSSSGKTTTMYAMLHWLNSHYGDRMNILTIEDPVERDLGFASQVQVNPAQDLTFERALRSALRQDPNVLMVGEIRDIETARVTIQAGMSGHLVVSTLHAGRASLVFSRLLSMGIEPYLVASAVSGAIAQRLARSVCHSCDGLGCEICGQSGCAGRVGIFECCRVSEELRELILACAPPVRVAEEAARMQTASLKEDARRLVEQGIISREEMEFIFAGEDRL
jgi:general secretion pathway protein E